MKSNSKPIRLNKFIAMNNVSSRRKADELIRDGKVHVNGKLVTDLATKVTPHRDSVKVSGRVIRANEDLVYVIFNKPNHVLSSLSFTDDRPTIASFFKKISIRLFVAEPLEWDSEGLLLLTNDSDLIEKIKKHKNILPKTYLIKLNGQPSLEHLQKLTRGVSMIGGKAFVQHAERSTNRGSEKYDWVKIVMGDRRIDQIRMMFNKIGFDVKKIQRIGIGALKLGTLERGEYKIISPDDMKKIFNVPKDLEE